MADRGKKAVKAEPEGLRGPINAEQLQFAPLKLVVDKKEIVRLDHEFEDGDKNWAIWQKSKLGKATLSSIHDQISGQLERSGLPRLKPLGQDPEQDAKFMITARKIVSSVCYDQVMGSPSTREPEISRDQLFAKYPQDGFDVFKRAWKDTLRIGGITAEAAQRAPVAAKAVVEGTVRLAAGEVGRAVVESPAGEMIKVRSNNPQGVGYKP